MSADEKKTSRKVDRRRLIGRIVGLAIVVTAAGCVAVVAAWPKPQREAPPQEVTPANVEVTTIVPVERVDDVLKLPGVVEPMRVIKVPAEVAGRIDRIAEGVAEGRRVSAGQEMIFINTELLKADHDRTKAAADFDEAEYKRLESLEKRGGATASELDAVRARRDTNLAALAATRAMLDRAVIKARQAGVLNDLPVEAGEYVTPGRTVAEIVEERTVKVVVDIPERDVGRFNVGNPEKVFVPGPERDKPLERTGKITFLSVQADPQTRTFRCEIVLDNADGTLRGGQILKVHMTRRTIDKAILIPLEAVIPLEKGHIVYVVEDGQARQRRVQIGILTGSSVQIVSGLAPGDRLIVSGHRYVGPGKPVKVVNAATQPATAPAGTSGTPDDQPATQSGIRIPDSGINSPEVLP